MRSQGRAIFVGGLLVLIGFAFLGSVVEQNRELHKAQIRRELLLYPPFLGEHRSQLSVDG